MRKVFTWMAVLAAVVSFSVMARAQGSDPATLKAEGKKAWEQRLDLEQARAAAQAFEKLAEMTPEDPEVAELAPRSYYWLGINAEDVEKKREYHMKGYEIGLKLCEAKENVACYYWAASNIGRYAQTLGSIKQKLYFRKVSPLMDKVKEMDDTYYYNGFYRYMAILTKKMSPTLRSFFRAFRDDFDFTLEEAENFIKTAIKAEPRYLLNHVTLAEIYLEEGKDVEAIKELNWVLKQDPDALPGLMPENVFEQKRAKEILEEYKKKATDK